MFTKLLGTKDIQKEPEHREGELYKVVTTFGKTFELRYGYYDERDRQSPLCAPAVIYPDFVKTPLYTDDGEPFVTMMQDACIRFKGEKGRTPDTTCADCKYFERGEEWFGICKYTPKGINRETKAIYHFTNKSYQLNSEETK